MLLLWWLGLALAGAAEPEVRVHLSFDDAPWMVERGYGVPLSVSDVAAANEGIIKALKAGDVRASVFFNCSRLRDGDGAVQSWARAGHTVGNHTDTHARLATMGPESWLVDARRCHDQLAAMGSTPQWMRYPYLGYGDGEEARDAATAGLAAMGERTAPVTVATTEWLHAYTYRRALRTGDQGLKAQVVRDYHAHLDAALEVAREASQQVTGGETAQVVLLHVNELAHDELPALIDRWTAAGVVFISLEQAMADPLFSMTNRYTGTSGVSWLWRVRAREDWGTYWFGHEEGRVQGLFGGIDPLDMGVPPTPSALP